MQAFIEKINMCNANNFPTINPFGLIHVAHGLYKSEKVLSIIHCRFKKQTGF